MEAQIRYARSGEVHIAYRTFGDGPRDIVLVPGTLFARRALLGASDDRVHAEELTSLARVIAFDKRGQGLSDRVTEMTLEERIGDVPRSWTRRSPNMQRSTVGPRAARCH